MQPVYRPTPTSPYEQELSRRVLDGEPDALEAAVELFDIQQPRTLAEAAGLVNAHGELAPDAFDCVMRAFDRYWHLRDMPCN